MGIYDRNWYQESGPRSRRSRSGIGSWSMVTKIIVLNVAVFLINGLLTENNALEVLLRLTSNTIREPWNYWKFLTYGFVHAPKTFWHIGGNMLSLFFLGYDVEYRLGSREFLRFYLATIIFGGVCWGLANISMHSACLGASGGVVGVVVLYALYFPHRTLLLWGVLPIPAWAIGAFVVGSDLFGAMGLGQEGIAFAVHLAGAAFAVGYFYFRWDFGNMLGSLTRPFAGWKSRKPKLNIYRPEEDKAPKRKTDDEKLGEKVDEILKKYSRYGESSLTNEERDILKKASEEYQKKYRR